MTQAQSDNSLIELGLRHHRAGEWPQAETVYRQILARNPNHPEALRLLGLVALEFGHKAPALQLISRALSLNPNSTLCLSNLAKALAANGRLDEAEEACRKALAIDPNEVSALAELGNLLVAREKPDEALDAYLAAVKLRPGLGDVWRALSNIPGPQGRIDEAIDSFKKVEDLRPEFLSVYNDLGCTEQARGKFDQAIEWYERALRVSPNSPEAHLNLGLTLLCCGDFERGLCEYEWRLKCPAWLAGQHFPHPLWDGRSDLRGKRLLVHAEQGYGDTFQLIRYVPILAERGPHIIFGCRPELEPLIRGFPGISEFLLVGGQVPQFDMQVYLASLPLLFGTTLQTIPGTVPYLFADPARAQRWRSRVESAGGRLKIGLAWRGQIQPDPRRAFRLGDAHELAQVEGAVFHSLQKGPGAEEATNPPPRVTVIDHANELSDFAETAALIANLDAVVSIDTAAAHLAGAMGKRAFTLLPFVASYQWLRDRDDSPWYPNTKLIRQPTAGDWQSVFRRLVSELNTIA